MGTVSSMAKKRLPPGGGVNISDTTLRDGAQMPGIFLSDSHKLRIFEYLHEIGIEKVECFVFSESDRRIVQRMLDQGYPKPRVTGWARANREDLDAVAGLEGIDETGILMSVSDLHIFKKLRFGSRTEAHKAYVSALSYALEKGLTVRCHLEDVTRADFYGFVAPLVREILQLHPDAILRLCDTVGIGLPDPNMDLPRSVPRLISATGGLGARSIETHMHDDFGLAVANSLIGFDYGARWTSATFLGIGERAGNAKLEEILINLHHVEGMEGRYNLSCLSEFAEFMEREVGVCLPANKAVVGRNAFVHRSGIHTAAVLSDPSTYEPYSPNLVGNERRLVLGPTSGTEILASKVNEILEEFGSCVRLRKNDGRLKAIRDELEQRYSAGDSETKISEVDQSELKGLVRKYVVAV